METDKIGHKSLWWNVFCRWRAGVKTHVKGRVGSALGAADKPCGGSVLWVESR